jgi:predicted Rossmann fold flavoprotein
MKTRVVIIGGGAAGFFSAITAAENNSELDVLVLEKSAHCLAKVRISGGGRCNVTHSEFDPRRFVAHYPRGGKELLGPLHRFQARDAVDWFRAHGVTLKTEADGRMFPVTDSSQTIVDCLQQAARAAGVVWRTRCDVVEATRDPQGGFHLRLHDGEEVPCDRLVLATGGTRSATGARLAAGLGHSLEPAVPSLFALHLDAPWLTSLAGISMPDVTVSLQGTKITARGPLVVTHKGLSGPAILRLSAWGARELHARRYAGELLVNWVPARREDGLLDALRQQTNQGARRSIGNTPLFDLPARLWSAVVQHADIPTDTRWQSLSRAQARSLVDNLCRMSFGITGKSTNKEEFVTCGGVRLREVDFRTMQSRVCPHLYVVGELLDIDALTGGFNFQSAWTTGWLAGVALAAAKTQSAKGT